MYFFLLSRRSLWNHGKEVSWFQLLKIKVKQVLVGISQENEQILDPIIEKLEPTDGQVPIKTSFDFKFVTNTWHGLKAALVRNYEALMYANNEWSLINSNLSYLQ